MKSEHKSRTELKIEDASSKMRNPPPWWWYGTTGTKKGYHTTKQAHIQYVRRTVVI